MQYRNYYSRFLAIYDECYADIVKMMKNKGELVFIEHIVKEHRINLNKLD